MPAKLNKIFAALGLMLGYVTGSLKPDEYKVLFKYQVGSSQVILIASLALFTAGPILSYFNYLIHGRFMVGGLVLFYLSVMYSQHPGFARFMPRISVSISLTVLSIIWAILFILEVWVWRIILALWACLMLALFLESGIGSIPLFYPNTFTVVGLISLIEASATGSLWPLLGFPLASLTSLMRRVEGRRRFSPLDIPYLALPIMLLFNNDYSLIALIIAQLMAISTPLTIPKKTPLSAAYPIGASLGRFGLAVALVLAIVGLDYVEVIHMVLIGFIAAMMTSLCIPMLIPGYLWIWPRGYGVEVPVLVELSALARIMYAYYGPWPLYISYALLYAAMADILMHYAMGERVLVQV